MYPSQRGSESPFCYVCTERVKTSERGKAWGSLVGCLNRPSSMDHASPFIRVRWPFDQNVDDAGRRRPCFVARRSPTLQWVGTTARGQASIDPSID